ncbi:hypothetical protein AXF42_Ash019886 [Apostasia shenzhenica]|uniref:Uncharacterized protein n=1 Tax=Apostasia shenzhenica TaxID=1088818 RepID=A0A2H9ZX44_9ASPA|nr:hypothetical protein AXF42_Ash019886 [Apostasia shenzhenica]
MPPHTKQTLGLTQPQLPSTIHSLSLLIRESASALLRRGRVITTSRAAATHADRHALFYGPRPRAPPGLAEGSGFLILRHLTDTVCCLIDCSPHRPVFSRAFRRRWSAGHDSEFSGEGSFELWNGEIDIRSDFYMRGPTVTVSPFERASSARFWIAQRASSLRRRTGGSILTRAGGLGWPRKDVAFSRLRRDAVDLRGRRRRYTAHEWEGMPSYRDAGAATGRAVRETRRAGSWRPRLRRKEAPLLVVAAA